MTDYSEILIRIAAAAKAVERAASVRDYAKAVAFSDELFYQVRALGHELRDLQGQSSERSPTT